MGGLEANVDLVASSWITRFEIVKLFLGFEIREGRIENGQFRYYATVELSSSPKNESC